MSKYQFKSGSRVKGVSAETVGVELERIRDRDGKIETKTVVDEARPTTAPLHPAFEWRDPVAAEHYREWQARQIVRSVRIVAAPSQEPTPAYVNVKPVTRGPGHYQATSVVVQDVDQYQRAMEAAIQKLRQAERAVRDLEAAADQSKNKDQLAGIGHILRSLTALENALQRMH